MLLVLERKEQKTNKYIVADLIIDRPKMDNNNGGTASRGPPESCLDDANTKRRAPVGQVCTHRALALLPLRRNLTILTILHSFSSGKRLPFSNL